MAEHNAAFAIKAEQQGTAFVADRHQTWREALCVIEERTVANDNTIAWSGRRLQLPEGLGAPTAPSSQASCCSDLIRSLASICPACCRART